MEGIDNCFANKVVNLEVAMKEKVKEGSSASSTDDTDILWKGI